VTEDVGIYLSSNLRDFDLPANEGEVLQVAFKSLLKAGPGKESQRIEELVTQYSKFNSVTRLLRAKVPRELLKELMEFPGLGVAATMSKSKLYGKLVDKHGGVSALRILGAWY
jgi:hypothetical protein